MSAITYIYEFREGASVVATGRLTREGALAVGDTVEINGRDGVVREVVSTLTPSERRVVLELR